MRQLGKVFLQGLAAVLPLTLTLYILWWLGRTAENVFGPALRSVLPDGMYLPGSGVAVGLGLVFVAGFVLRAWWVRSLWSGLEGLLEHIPLVKTIYGSVRDLMTFFADGEGKRELDQVVMVRMGNPALQLIGLITRDDAAELTGRAADSDQVAVYLPMSYQIGGFMVLVPRNSVEPIELGVEDALRTIVTAGLSKGPAASKR